MSVLAVIPLYLRNETEYEVARQTVKSLRATAPRAKCLVVDDCSPAQDLVGRLDHDLLAAGYELRRQPTNEGFATTVNVGLREARREGHDALLVNADIFFHEDGWLDAMTAREEAVVGARLLYPNGLIQHAGVYFSMVHRSFDHIHKFAPGNLALAQKERICPVTAALMLIKNEVLHEILFDENFRMGWEDVSFCHDVFESGRLCVYEPKACAIHHESLFRGSNPSKKIQQWTEASWRYLHEKHAGAEFVDHVPTILWDEEDS